MTTTSLSLLERAGKHRDPVAWQHLTELYTPLLARWLGRYAVQSADSDDLVQEVLLTVARELPHFQHAGNRGSFRAWLRTILSNRLKAYWRKQRRQGHAVGSDSLTPWKELADPHSRLSLLWEQEHDEYLLERLLGMVALRFQAGTMSVFRRVVIDGEAPAAVAQELNISLNSVIIAKCRVLKELRREAQGLLDA